MDQLDRQLLGIVINLGSFTAKQLANKLNISEKTARERLKRIETEVSRNGGKVSSKPGKGHLFQIVDKKRFATWYEEIQKVTEALPTTAQGRINYILHKLLYAKEFIKLDDLSDELFVSRTTMTTDMRQVKYILQLHRLTITQRPGYGICVDGSEFDIRNCIVYDLLQEDEQTGNQDWATSGMQKIVDSIAFAFKQYNLNLAKPSFLSLLLYVSIAIERLQDGRYICFEKCFRESLQDRVSKDVTCAAQMIGMDMFRWIGCEYSEDEIAGLMLQIQAKGVFSFTPSGSSSESVSKHIEMIAKTMLETIYEVHGLDFRDDAELTLSLIQHLVPFDVRMRYNLPLANPLLEQIKQEYAVAYHISVSACIALQKEYGTPIPEEEIGHFAALFAWAIQRLDRPPRKNVLVVCISGQATSKLFLHRYQTALGPYTNHIYACSAFQLSTFDFVGLKIDYVFTTVPLHLKLPVPVFEVSLLLEDWEINKFRHILQGEGKNFLLQYFKESLFCGKIVAESKEHALATMCRIVAESIPLPADFLSSVLTREKMGQTDFGNLIAIPHPSQIMGTEKFVSVAILEKPIWWGHNDVQVILLISLEQNDLDVDRFYQVVSDLMGSPAAIQTLIKKPTFQTLLDVLDYQ